MKTNQVPSCLKTIVQYSINSGNRWIFNLNSGLGLLCCLLFGLVLAVNSSLADAPITMVVDMSSSGTTPPADFAGLSFGTTVLGGTKNFIFDTNTTQSPKCPQVMTLCSNMGLKELRIGGASVDYKVPLVDYTYTGIDALFNFASALNINVIYSLRCINSSNGDDYATVDGQIAGHIWSNTVEKACLNSFAIGNEPSKYPNDDSVPVINNYNNYQNKWQSIAVKVVGNTSPSVGFSATDDQQDSNWTARFITNRQNGVITNHIFNATQHWYIGGSASGVSATNAINYILSASRDDTDYPNWVSGYADRWFSWNYRMTEADEYYTGGVHGESDTFTAALWGLDFLCWMAQYPHCQGVHFHNTLGDYTDTILTDANGNYLAGAKWAAIKMFTLLYNGATSCKSGVITNIDGVNVTGYASGDSTDCYALLVNKSNYVTGNEWSVMLTVMPSHFTAHNAEYIKMDAWPTVDDPTQPNAQVGGATNSNSSAWSGTWTSLGVTNNACSVECRHASAVLVHIY